MKLLSHGVGGPGLARVPSISLIVTLPEGNKYRWKMQKVYFFHIQLDRIVITTYRAYRHELYFFLLEQMVKTAQALATLG